MKYTPGIHRRRSIRLAGYDYSQSGACFVTICAQGRECLFGDIVDGEMQMNDAGQMVNQCWNDITAHFPYVEPDEFVVMPNHVHGIIVIVGAPLVGAHSFGMINRGTENRAGTRPAPTLGDVVGVFKSITTHQYVDGVRHKKWPLFHTRLWQRNYYEHIIRNEESLQIIRRYIINNPLKWDEDEDNPGNISGVIHGARATLCGRPPDITTKTVRP